MKGILLFLLTLGLGGCPGGGPGHTLVDTDGDGTLDELDCAPEDPSTYPGANDFYGDGVDQNCDGVDGVDNDGDGYPAPGDGVPVEVEDCNDSNPEIYPGALDFPGNGIDEDCDGVDEDLDSARDGSP